MRYPDALDPEETVGVALGRSAYYVLRAPQDVGAGLHVVGQPTLFKLGTHGFSSPGEAFERATKLAAEWVTSDRDDVVYIVEVKAVVRRQVTALVDRES